MLLVIYGIYPTQHASGKWSFTLRFPPKNVIILLVSNLFVQVIVISSHWGVIYGYLIVAAETKKPEACHVKIHSGLGDARCPGDGWEDGRVHGLLEMILVYPYLEVQDT